MPLMPFFPSLKPQANHIWFDLDTNEESEVSALEKENNHFLNRISNMGADLNPLGKVVTIAGQETDDDEDANDDTDSDSHDDEDDDEIDRLLVDSANRTQMDTPYSPIPLEEQNSNNEIDEEGSAIIDNN